MAVRHAAHLAAERLRLVQHPLEHLAPVAVLHDADAAAGDVPQILSRLPQDRLGQDAGTGVEVVDAFAHGCSVDGPDVGAQDVRVAEADVLEGVGGGSPEVWMRASVA
jgi:hypothetical protein